MDEKCTDAARPVPAPPTAICASGVLLVDDNVTFCETLARTLRRRRIETWIAHDAATALTLVEQEPAIGRIVLDLHLCRPISGLQLIPKLLERKPQLAIVLLTAYASIATATEAIRLGAVHYLAKPVDVDELLAAFAARTGNAAVPIGDEVLSCRQLEWERLSWALVRHHGNVSAAARFLGLERRSLQRKLHKHARR